MLEAEVAQLRRRFVRKFLDMHILRYIRERPSWGYEIILRLERDYGVKVGYGVIYPMLGSLERRGLIEGKVEVKGGRRRKVYRITQSGIKLLQAFQKMLRQQFG